MNFLKRIVTSFSQRDRYKQIQLLWQQGIDQAKVKNFEDAHASFFKLLDYRAELEKARILQLALMCLTSTWMSLERYDEAIEFFSGYVSRFPRDPEGYVGRACGFWYSDRLESAMKDYSRALDLMVTHTRARSNRGQVLAEMAKPEQAMADFDIALPELEKAQNNAPPGWIEFYRQSQAFVHRGRGVALAGLGLCEKAMEEFELSISMHPANA